MFYFGREGFFFFFSLLGFLLDIGLSIGKRPSLLISLRRRANVISGKEILKDYEDNINQKFELKLHHLLHSFAFLMSNMFRYCPSF